MLSEFRVKNFGIIEEISWEPGKGFNVITGETGAGKSLVIDAVELLLSGKSKKGVIRHGADTASVEGVFELCPSKNPRLSNFLEEKGLTPEDNALIIKITLKRGGKDSVRINGSAVTKADLAKIGGYLIDIHGQSDHLSLLKKDNHLSFLDSYGGTNNLRNEFKAEAEKFYAMDGEINKLTEEARSLAQKEDLLKFQIDEISKAELVCGEEAELKKEREILGSVTKLKELSFEAHQALQGEESSFDSNSAIDKLNSAVQSLKNLTAYDDTLKEQLSALEEALYGTMEASREISSYNEGLEFDPNRLEEIETRLGLISTLKKKYGDSEEEILAFKENAENELNTIENSGAILDELKAKKEALKQEMGMLASKLNEGRKEAAEKLKLEVEKHLSELNMAGVKFSVYINLEEREGGIPFPCGSTYGFSSSGADKVEFMVSTNPGEPFMPLSVIASTGEISRFMLALKSALSAVGSTPVLIFDEIDIGVGGRSGEIIGKKLYTLSVKSQVICITHLPQIASFADSHYKITKQSEGERTTSALTPLDSNKSLEELSVMLGGEKHTAAALDTAKELAVKAYSWKQQNR